MNKKIIKTELIENYIMDNKISKSKFCRQCHIGYKTLKKVLHNQFDFDIVVLFKISRLLDIYIKDLFCS